LYSLKIRPITNSKSSVDVIFILNFHNCPFNSFNLYTIIPVDFVKKVVIIILIILLFLIRIYIGGPRGSMDGSPWVSKAKETRGGGGGATSIEIC